MAPQKIQGWMSTGEMARRCGVNRGTMLRWLKDGRLPSFVTPGGHRRVRTAEFETFFRQLALPGAASSLSESGRIP